jgi:uncharacterized protein YbjT (DUF2867 family)
MARRICLVGGTGEYLGSHVTRAAIAAGHDVTVVGRGKSSRNAAVYDEFTALGVNMVNCASTDIDLLTETFRHMDVVFCFPGIGSARSVQIRYLLAAKRAGVGRFIPDEFGCDTRTITYGKVGMFDDKKDFAAMCEVSGLPYTLIFNHCVSEWMLPRHCNMDYFHVIGDGDVPYLTVHKRDVAALAVRIALDPRCANQAVSLNGCGATTVKACIAMLRASWPGYTFNYKTKTSEFVTDCAINGSLTAEPGQQSLREREELNRLVWVDGLSAVIGDDVLRATNLYPDYPWFTIAAQLADRNFVFGEK